MNALSLIDIHKTFGATRALDGVSFDVQPGEIISLLGPSGCGKSTALSIIAGLEPPDRGQVLWEGESLEGVPPHRRGFGLMFQDFALFPHLNVFENVAFGLRLARLPMPELRQRVAQVLELVGLPAFDSRDVNTLSGGEQQRVALARSLAPRPRLLMLDEPLGALDRNLRERLVTDLGPILRELRQTAVYVTHDQEEAFALADQVVVMNAGQVEQAAAPQELYRHPASPFVARFLGLANLLQGSASPYESAGGAHSRVDTPVGALYSAQSARGPVTALLRPDSARLLAEPGLSASTHTNGETLTSVLSGRLLRSAFRGTTCRAAIEIRGVELVFDFLSSEPLTAPGQPVRLAIDPDGVQIFETWETP